jgi:hypothetical protein
MILIHVSSLCSVCASGLGLIVFIFLIFFNYMQSEKLLRSHFDPPGPNDELSASLICANESIALSMDGAAQGSTLIKNVDSTLPLQPAQTVAVIGPNSLLSSSVAGYYGPSQPCGNQFWTMFDAVSAHVRNVVWSRVVLVASRCSFVNI